MNQSLTFETSPIYAIRCGFFCYIFVPSKAHFPHIAQANLIFYLIFFPTPARAKKKTHTNTKREKSDKQETVTLNPKRE